MGKSGEILEQENQALKRITWEALRRNPDYQTSYNKFQELENVPGDEARQTRIVFHLEISEKYPISSPIDYKKNFSKEVAKNLSPSILFKYPNRSVWFPIKESSFRVIDDHEPSGRPKIRPAKRSEALEGGKIITLGLDIDLPDKQIREMVSSAVKLAKRILVDDTKEGAKERWRYEDDLHCFTVWDLHRTGKSFPEIGKTEWPNIDVDNASDRAKREYKKADQMIQLFSPNTQANFQQEQPKV